MLIVVCSLYEQNFNVRTFRYETPFTKSGKAHGDVDQQWKRRTTLTVEAAFPHVRSRLAVIDTQTADFEPIESVVARAFAPLIIRLCVDALRSCWTVARVRCEPS